MRSVRLQPAPHQSQVKHYTTALPTRYLVDKSAKLINFSSIICCGYLKELSQRDCSFERINMLHLADKNILKFQSFVYYELRFITSCNKRIWPHFKREGPVSLARILAHEILYWPVVKEISSKDVSILALEAILISQA